LPLEQLGEFAQGLEASRAAALDLYHRLKTDPRFVVAFEPELDIVVFAPRAESVGESSALARKIFDAAASRNLHLALATLPVKFFAANLGSMKKDQQALTCLRSVLMKPEHQRWLPKLWQALNDATNDALKP
jgi:tyrosine decarboxylase/aspartate 1-decarboxylase